MNDLYLPEELKEYDSILIFGANDYGIALYNFLTSHSNFKSKKIYLCDNSKHKRELYKEYKVLTVEEAADKYPLACYFLMSARYREIMEEQLISLGINQERILFGVTAELEEKIDRNRAQTKLKPLDKLQFEVDITAHCNLNCKCCSQFSCISKPEYIDLDAMERDFKRLSDLFNGEVERIYLIGGEPLLHPKLTDCMRIARTYFPIGKIYVFSNGILLSSQSDAFWKCCKKYDISIIVTKYPISLNHSEIEKLAIKHEVDFHFFGTSEDFKYMTSIGLDLEGKQKPEGSFVKCMEANNCIKLRDGKLYTCTRPAAIYKFNEYFKKNLTVDKDDYVDIYTSASGEEILRRLAKPIPFCRYCNMRKIKNAMPWGTTKKDILEWL